MKQCNLGLVLSFMVPVCMAAPPSYADVQFNIDTAKIVAPTSVAHPVGSCYGGGVVYYVNPAPDAPVGQRGLIAAPTDASTSARWFTGSATTSLISTSSLYFTGLANTNQILNGLIIITPDNAQAATAANTYTSTPIDCPNGACTNWYLPSQDELATLYFQSSNIAGFGTNCSGYVAPAADGYWSSTQGNILIAWFVQFSNGVIGGNPLNLAYRVRAVRAF